MAAINVEVTSKEMIKPTSPTPQHLKILNLSSLDQVVPRVYIPFLFFYQTDQTTPSLKDEHLKQSLSEILTHFYPLAGTVEDDRSINCSDDGVEFISARVIGKLTEVIEKPQLEELKSLLPFEPFGGNKNVVLGVQVNHFIGCGGVVIGVCMSHKIADGTATTTFMNAWAAMARGAGDLINLPKFDSPEHFPSIELKIPTDVYPISKEKIATRRIVFDRNMINKLKENATVVEGSKATIKDPTRVEVVSAFIWEIMIKATKAKCDPNQTAFAVSHAVNLRTRMKPPLSQQTFGNVTWCAIGTTSMIQDTEFKYQNLVGHLRSAIKKIDNGFIKKLQSDDFLIELKKAHEHFANSATSFCNFSSWCKFPMYEVDFGWGTPIWVCTTTLPSENQVVFLSTKSGDGIEAWVNIVEEDVAMFEHHLDHLLSLER